MWVGNRVLNFLVSAQMLCLLNYSLTWRNPSILCSFPTLFLDCRNPWKFTGTPSLLSSVLHMTSYLPIILFNLHPRPSLASFPWAPRWGNFHLNLLINILRCSNCWVTVAHKEFQNDFRNVFIPMWEMAKFLIHQQYLADV